MVLFFFFLVLRTYQGLRAMRYQGEPLIDADEALMGRKMRDEWLVRRTGIETTG
jgi:hypothetical protein